MRQIKFRVWNKKTNNWVEGCGPNELSSLDGVNLFGETILLGGFMDGVSIEDLDECVALQFTGLKDNNDKDIFEGDILRVSFRNSSFIKQVRWLGAGFDISPSNEMYNYEVIGNIFENLELIK